MADNLSRMILKGSAAATEAATLTSADDVRWKASYETAVSEIIGDPSSSGPRIPRLDPALVEDFDETDAGELADDASFESLEKFAQEAEGVVRRVLEKTNDALNDKNFLDAEERVKQGFLRFHFKFFQENLLRFVCDIVKSHGMIAVLKQKRGRHVVVAALKQAEAKLESATSELANHKTLAAEMGQQTDEHIRLLIKDKRELVLEKEELKKDMEELKREKEELRKEKESELQKEKGELKKAMEAELKEAKEALKRENARFIQAKIRALEEENNRRQRAQ